MSGPGPARRRRIAGERTSGTTPASSPTALPRTPAAPPVRPGRTPARPARPGGGADRPTSRPSVRPPATGPRPARTPLRGLLRPPRHERRWFVPLAAVAALVLVAGLVLAGRGAWQVWQERDAASARDAAASAAGTAIETMYTYDSRNLEDARDAERLMTPSFRSEYARIIDTLGELGDQRQITISSTARDTAAMPCGEECSATRQRVMVFFDLSRTSGEGTVPDVFGNRVALTMVERDGRWLVGDIQVL